MAKTQKKPRLTLADAKKQIAELQACCHEAECREKAAVEELNQALGAIDNSCSVDKLTYIAAAVGLVIGLFIGLVL